MKRKERDEAEEGDQREEEVETKSEKEEGVKRLKEDTAVRAPSALHDSVVHELRRLGAQANGGATATSSSSTTPATDATTSTSSSASASGQLAPSFVELNSFAFPSDVLFESEAWDLCEVELRNWWAPSTRGGRPAVEIGSAKRRSSDTYVYLALPTDTANPAHPVLFIKQKDGRDGPIGADDEGIPLADFLAGLQVPGDEEEDDDDQDDDDDGGDNADPYSGFISAIVAGEELPSEDEDDDDHDADQDDEEDADFELEDEGDD